MRIISVHRGSQAEHAGLRPGDRIAEINGGPARDHIDMLFYGAEDEVRLKIHRGTYEFLVSLDGNDDFGIELEPMKIRRCGNKCIFCFIDQNPPGMRKEIYVKDEDYRLSFLHGSYVTLSNLRESDLERIVAQRLSPLYVSMHATDTETRRKMLGAGREDASLSNMDRLLDAGIRMHCQIVVCPGLNDGDILEKTIGDLRKRYPGIVSVAVVPVGLTRHREGLPSLRAVDGRWARGTIGLVDTMHSRYREETGDGFVYCADEWYIRAGMDIPVSSYYDDFPQLENGVGMVRDFLDSVSDIAERLAGRPRREGKFVFVTGTSMSRFMEDAAREISRVPGIEVRTVTVSNRFYGDSVTVSGLLTGRDISDALRDVRRDETVVLPPNCLNVSGLFLDDMTPGEVSAELGVEVIVGDYDPAEVFSPRRE